MLQEPVPCSRGLCKHYRGVAQLDGTEASEVDVCSAFPKGIPPEIATGVNLHTEPYPGDNGIQYAKGSPEEIATSITAYQREHAVTAEEPSP